LKGYGFSHAARQAQEIHVFAKPHVSQYIVMFRLYAVARCCPWLPNLTLTTFDTPCSCIVTP